MTKQGRVCVVAAGPGRAQHEEGKKYDCIAMSSSSSSPRKVIIKVFDPHFHVWDVDARPNGNLGKLPDSYRAVSLKDYERAVGSALEAISFSEKSKTCGVVPVRSETSRLFGDAGDEKSLNNLNSAGILEEDPATELASLAFVHVGGVHVETVVGQDGKEGSPVVDGKEETTFVLDALHPSKSSTTSNPKLWRIVAYADLSERNSGSLAADLSHHETTIADNDSNIKLSGVRMILNHHEDEARGITWPQVSRDFLQRGNSANGEFFENYATLGISGLSFDLQCNPHQLLEAAVLASTNPDIKIAVNHLACLHLTGDGWGEENDLLVDEWRDGMHALSHHPNVYVKISMLPFLCENFWQSEAASRRVREIAEETVAIFGYERCMIASNFPVDVLSGLTAEKMYETFFSIFRTHGIENIQALFGGTAANFYGARI